MNVIACGKYELTEDKRYTTSNSSFGLRKGSIIQVTQMSIDGKKFYSPELGDWNYMIQPFKKVSE